MIHDFVCPKHGTVIRQSTDAKVPVPIGKILVPCLPGPPGPDGQPTMIPAQVELAVPTTCDFNGECGLPLEVETITEAQADAKDAALVDARLAAEAALADLQREKVNMASDLALAALVDLAEQDAAATEQERLATEHAAAVTPEENE